MEYNAKEFRTTLNNLVDEEYRLFVQKLGIGKLKPIGIRLPELKTLAKELAKSNWQEFFEREKEDCPEVIMLKALVIGYAKTDFDTFAKYLIKVFDKVESWSEVDTCAANSKIIKKNREKTFELIYPFLFCKEEYKVRLAVIILMDHFLVDEWIDKVLELLPQIEQGVYYIDMGIAWTLSVCFVKFKDKTLKVFEQKKFSQFVQNKAIQKCRESFRVSAEDKELLKNYKI